MQRSWGIVLGPAVALGVLLLAPGGMPPAAVKTAAVAALMAIWWITEALPLAATALVPAAAFPLLGVLPGRAVAVQYFNSTILLFLGGFLIALAMQRWHLHRRIALGVIAACGADPRGMVWGFLVAAAFLSMWISNTATAVMMVPIALAVLAGAEEEAGPEAVRPLAVGIMLAVAYGASIGGVATLVGTPPNLALARIYEISVPGADPIGFGQWLLLGLPVTLGMMACAGWLLSREVRGVSLGVGAEAVQAERAALGPMTGAEGKVLAVFAATALLWVFRKDLSLGALTVPGWSGLLPWGKGVDDGTVAAAMALLLFLIPARTREGASARLLDQETFHQLPWHIILLFGGGFALAKAFLESGLSAWVGERLAAAADLPAAGLVALTAGGVSLLTELTSNTATTELVLPVVAATAKSLGLEPLLLMIPATLGASFAFMLPVATPPNAIAFASGRLRVKDMVRVGVVLNLFGIAWVTLVGMVLIPLAFG